MLYKLDAVTLQEYSDLYF